VMRRELAGVLDDHPNAPRELEVVQQPGDFHDSSGSRGSPDNGRPSLPSSSWM
jgi:hypothetical protein